MRNAGPFIFSWLCRPLLSDVRPCVCSLRCSTETTTPTSSSTRASAASLKSGSTLQGGDASPLSRLPIPGRPPPPPRRRVLQTLVKPCCPHIPLPCILLPLLAVPMTLCLCSKNLGCRMERDYKGDRTVEDFLSFAAGVPQGAHHEAETLDSQVTSPTSQPSPPSSEKSQCISVQILIRVTLLAPRKKIMGSNVAPFDESKDATAFAKSAPKPPPRPPPPPARPPPPYALLSPTLVNLDALGNSARMSPTRMSAPRKRA